MATNTRKRAGRSRRRSLGAKVELTDKQKEIVSLATEGLTVAQAAARLGIAESGVYNHAKRIRDKGVKIEFAKGDAHPAVTAAATNGGGTPDADLTTAARNALGNDAAQYLSALDQVKQECVNRRAEIATEVTSLQGEDDALGLRIEKLAARQAEAARVVEQIEALA